MDAAAQLHNRKILIADTDQAQLVSLMEGLKQRGFSVHIAIDGSKALELALSIKPDVIALGLDLPVVRTKQLMDILSVNPKTKTLPVLVMAARPIQLKKLGLEPTDHLVQPVHVEALLDRIYKLYKKMDKVHQVGDQAKEIEGNLSQIPVGDLLQVMNINKKDGCIQLERNGSSGFIFLQDGQVINASLGKIEGEKAFFRLIEWEDGKFEYSPSKALSPVRIKSSIENLLMEGMRQVDEKRKLTEKMPPPDAHLALNVDPSNLPKGLRPITQEIFLLMEFYSNVQELVDHCLYPDYEVMQTLYTLIGKGLVKVVDQRKKVTQQSILGPNEIQQLHKMLTGYRQEKLGKVYGKILLFSQTPDEGLAFLNRCRSIEGFASLTEARRPNGKPIHVGPLAKIVLGDMVELQFFHLPINRLSLPYWHAFQTNAIGGFFLFMERNAKELAQLQRAHQFYLATPKPHPVYIDLGAEADENFHKQARKLFHLEENSPIVGREALTGEGTAPDLIKTALIRSIN